MATVAAAPPTVCAHVQCRSREATIGARGSDGEGGYAVDAASEAGSSLFDQSEGEADGASAFGESEVSDGGASEVSELTFGAPSEGGF